MLKSERRRELTTTPHQCDRCGRETFHVEPRASSFLCLDCVDALHLMTLTMFFLDVERWARRPLNVAAIRKVTYAA